MAHQINSMSKEPLKGFSMKTCGCADFKHDILPEEKQK